MNIIILKSDICCQSEWRIADRPCDILQQTCGLLLNELFLPCCYFAEYSIIYSGFLSSSSCICSLAKTCNHFIVSVSMLALTSYVCLWCSATLVNTYYLVDSTCLRRIYLNVYQMRPTCGLLLIESNIWCRSSTVFYCSAKHINKAANRMRQFRIIGRNVCKRKI